MPTKMRLDVRLQELNLANSREKARAFILSGKVYVNEQKIDKVAHTVSKEDAIQVRGNALPFVSRGGLKLDKAIRAFSIDLSEKICIDIGASTGGFTDCMLQNRAKKVYAVDVGYGQLDWTLRNNQQVSVLERRNARYMQSDWFESPPEFAGMDVSFISVSLILPALYKILDKNAQIITLIKPQFEAGKDKVGKKGVVRDAQVHLEVITKIMSFARKTGYGLLGLDYSPITGPKGNVEFLLYANCHGKSNWNFNEDSIQAENCLNALHKDASLKKDKQ